MSTSADLEPGQPTGPRTEAGKQASSANATTHGLTARRPLCEEEAERLVAVAQRWTAKHLPETEPEEALIQSAAIEYVRYLRCVDADELRLRPAADEALDAWEQKRRHAVRRKAQDLEKDPARVAAELLGTAFGIDWMLRRWQSLVELLDTGRGWRGDDLVLSLHLLGKQPRRPDEADIDARRLWDLATASFPGTIDPKAAPGQVDDLEALESLRTVLEDQIARLQALRPIVWEEVDAPQARVIETDAMIDTTPQGQLRQRYRREALRDMQKSLGLIMRLRVERSKMDARQARLERSGLAPRRPDPTESSPPEASPAPTAPRADPDPVGPRNEPSPAADRVEENPRNPNPDNVSGKTSPDAPPSPPRRTGSILEGRLDRPGPFAGRDSDGPRSIPMPRFGPAPPSTGP